MESTNTYYFEIDTNIQFSSPFLKNQSVVSIGGVIEAIPGNWINSISSVNDSLFFGDSIVYYWRSRPDSSIVDWKVRSFQYIPKTWGWSQSHIGQFKENKFLNIVLDTLNNTYNFFPTLKSITCKNHIQHVALGSEWSGTYWEVSGEIADYGGHTSPAVMVGVVDPNSCLLYTSDAADE